MAVCVFVGIDPGKKGAWAVLRTDGTGSRNVSVKVWDDQKFTEDMRDIVSWTQRRSGNVFCVVEKVGAMPGQGVTSMFTFGKSCGYIEGVLRALEIPYQLVPPKTWKKEWSLTNDKNLSVETCRKLFPNVSLKPTERCRNDSDGMAEAVLMAEYARRHC